MSDKEYFCAICGSSYRFGGGDYQYEITNILCPNCNDEHIALLTSRLTLSEAVVEEARKLMTCTNMPHVSAQPLYNSIKAYDKGKP